MKRLLPLLLFAAMAGTANAQTVTLSLATTPCNNDGVLSAVMTGFTPPLTVSWSTSGTTGTVIQHTVASLSDVLTSYSGGPVSVSVFDGVNTASASFGGAPPFTYAFTLTPEICPTAGTASVTVSGGTAPFTYQWFDVNTSAVVGSGSSITANAGQYGVVITDGSGCTYGSKVNTDIGVIGYTSFGAVVTTTPANCTDGSATVTVDAGAVLPVSYSWSNGATTPSIAGLIMGNYSVTVTDAAGCKATDPAFGPGYYPPTFTVAQTTALTTAVTTTSSSCAYANGSVSATVSGGTVPYTYLWSNGATGATQSGLAANTYNVTIKDANGCIAYDEGFVASTSAMTVSMSTTPSLCSSPSGNATVTASGGSGTYSYQWYTTPTYTGPTATFLLPGDYVCKVTDGAGCVQYGFGRVSPIDLISTSFLSLGAACTSATGSLTVTPTGGVTPYSYSWNTGATGAALSGVAAGTYTVTITDGLGCKVSVAHDVASNSPVGVGLVSTPASCILSNDGSVTATVFGGTAPYSYGWSSGGTSATITGLRPGSYWMHVTDAAGCKATSYTYVGYDATNTACYCTIQGTVFADTNGNCTQEPTETGIANMQVFCSGIGYTYTDANGGYSFLVPTGSYTITENPASYYPLSSCQANGLPVTTTAGAGCLNTVNFANSVLPTHNLSINTSSATSAVPGLPYIQKVTIMNDGNVTEDSVVTSYKADGQFYSPLVVSPVAFSVTPPYYFATAAGATSLAPGASASYYMSYYVPGNMHTGVSVASRDTVASNAPASSYALDNSPADNTNAYTATTVANWNDNMCEVSPKGSGANGYITYSDSVLMYTISFSNETYYVENVIVTDTLDGNLDWTTLHPVYGSSPCKVTMSQAGSYKVATFTFNTIDLANGGFEDLRMNGSLTYTIRTMPGLATGTQIRNRASVLYDQHEPVLTNTTLNTLTNSITGVANTPAALNNSFLVYPNPAGAFFNAVVNNSNTGNALMTITDVTGRTIYTQTIAMQKGPQSVHTDVSGIATGTYFISISQDGKTETQKLVIMK